MSINFRDLGWWKDDNDFASRPNKVVLPTSTGTTLIIVPDGNEPEPNAQNSSYGSGSGNDAIYIYEANAAFTSISIVGSMDIGGGWDKPYDQLSADLYEDNSIGIVFQRQGSSVFYRKVTYGTWAQSAIETIGTPAGTVRSLDLSISEANIPAVAWIETADTNPKASLRTYVRNTSNNWIAATTQTLMTTADPNLSMLPLSLQFAKGGSNTARPLAVAVGLAQNGGTDHGLRISSMVVNETTGAIVNFTLRKVILAGDMTTSWGTFVRRGYLFRSGNAELTVVYIQATDKKNLTIARYGWDGNTWTEVIAPQSSQIARAIIPSARFAAAYANDRVVVLYASDYAGIQSIINYNAQINRTDGSVRFSGPFKFDNLENTSHGRWYPMGGTGKRADTTTKHPFIFFGVNNNNLWDAYAHDVKAPPAPISVEPATDSPVNTGTPALGMRATLGKQWPQAKHKAQWQLAKDAGFTTSLRDYTQSDDKLVTIENTQLIGSYYFIGDTLPQELALTSGTWYVRGRLIDELGNVGSWSGVNNFSLAHPPSAINRSPNTGTILLEGGVTFTWTFTDPLATDTQTAFQIIVEKNDDGTVVYDTGKVGTSAASHLANIDSQYYGTLLRWKIRLWDADDAPGEYSEYETFLVATAPTVVINSPGGSVASGTPQITFTPTVGNDRTIKTYRVTITQGGTIVKDSGMIPVDVVSGTQLSWRPTLPLLTQGGTYSAQATVWDQYGMSGTSPVSTFTVNMVLPATASGVAADAINYNVESAGYVSVYWTNANLDTNFEAWIVERKSDFIDAANQVLSEGTWEEVGQVATTATSYEYRDYYAPSGYKVNYRVRQLVNRLGDRAISDPSSESTVYPISEGYWIIEPVDDTSGESTAFRLNNVTADSYTDEYEESEYVVIGRGRHVDRGEYLGPKGSMTAQLRDSLVSTARQKRLQLEAARGSDSVLYIRNPFGDVIPVNIGNLSITRIAGVGRSEFVDVEIPYSKVGV